MTNFEYPSEQFPAFPAISLTAPDDWSAISATDVVVAVGQDVAAGEFRPNVVVAMTRFAAGYELPTAVAAVTDRFGELPGVVEIGRESKTILGQPGFRIEASFSDERVGVLVQAVQITVIPNGAVVDLVQITGTATAAQAKEMWPVIRDVQNSVALAAQ